MSLPPEQPHERRSPSGEMNYKGVRQRKSGSWVSEVRLPNSRERIWLGSYYTPEKAARAFDAASLCLRGPGGADGLNFPSSPPAVRRRTNDRKEVLAAALSHANQSAATESPSANGGAPMERVPTLPPAEPKVSPEAESTDWSQLLPPMPSPIRMGSHTYLPVSPTAAAAEDVDMEEEDSGSCYGLWSPSFW
ncbi:ethylene-responsive transcription factor ERF015 [Setaria viridis]|uniref:AP2/ERF domain-containing protein n=1 Tax=Setaria viridis TaxID=4556 RepID=A0A4U6UY14_SETVI|nr:ethylene-responsive transcription factor ERF017-like [Setaria viridis]TKW19703.1 hypothetical protein SEVIR_4G037400v2 [Setaria viridis]